jgi:DNA polymerase III delta prime subunit
VGLATGANVLKNRYALVDGPRASNGGAAIWEALDDNDNAFLIKTWSYQGEQPDRVQRALWDHELRTLYKVASSPHADDTLVVLRDAGLDRDNQCFVMVLAAPGFIRVDDAVRRRSRYKWLASRATDARERLWAGLGQVAEGLRLLHNQQVLHRDVSLDSLFFTEDEGPESLRLGGFEWSVRVGRPVGTEPPDGWSTPPERFGDLMAAWRQNDDWFGFGIVCARLLLDLENFGNNEPGVRHQRVLRTIETAVSELTEAERKLLLALVAENPLDRITAAHDIINRIAEIVQMLSGPEALRTERAQHTLVVNLRDHKFVDYLMENGLRDALGLKQTQSLVPDDPLHRQQACQFIREDFKNGILYAVPNREYFILVGGRLSVRIIRYAGRDRVASWDLAECRGAQPLRYSEGGTTCREVPDGSIFVYPKESVSRDRTIAQAATPWDRMLPKIDNNAAISRELQRFHNFVRASNQIELLLLDAQIFPYVIVSGPTVTDGVEQITVAEGERRDGHEVFEPFQMEFVDYLQKEAMNGSERTSVILSGPEMDRLRLPSRNLHDPANDEIDLWQVESLDQSRGHVLLSRQALDSDRNPPARAGHLRSAGMPGQISLLQRRKRAIDALDQHSYLLRSLTAPAQVRMDTGAVDLLVPLPADKVDDAKRAAIQDILRVRPIYTLQGPPGTGKTTLVAWLLREILAEDPVVQVLVTAQAHPAVDVLRAKVGEAFTDVPWDDMPLEVRLGARKDDAAPLVDGAEAVAREVLQRSVETLSRVEGRTEVQQAWLDDAADMLRDIDMMQGGGELGKRSSDFVELVKRGANVTYCTTSASDLVALAAGQAFDWAIVEEAGRAHAFDLALPLQAGHRWLLIGDHKQLKPYRYEDYRDGIAKLERAAQILASLKPRASNLLDQDWLDSWDQLSPAERREFEAYSGEWIRTFEELFEHSTVAGGVDKQITTTEPVGASAGRLVGQHRMHPDVGELISTAYYENALINRTETPQGPMDRVRHGYTTPAGVAGKAVVWLDVPWCRHDPRTRERGPADGAARYTNPAEAHALKLFLSQLGPEGALKGKLAVLAPYARQVSHLREYLKRAKLPEGLAPQVSLTRGRNPDLAFEAHTVDSFQGNQADVVAVSLVRNNEEIADRGLGFLDDDGRMNVLLSRAERLLVLVGSWDFFNHQLHAVPLNDRSQPLLALKTIVSQLGEWFDTGRAVRLDADLRGL